MDYLLGSSVLVARARSVSGVCPLAHCKVPNSSPFVTLDVRGVTGDVYLVILGELVTITYITGDGFAG